MFRASLCPSSGEQRPPVIAFGVLFWFCWMWLAAVVGHCLVVLTSNKTAPHNRYQPHPTEQEQYTKCNNRAFALMKMMMPETC